MGLLAPTSSAARTFDYSELPDDVAAEARAVAERIRGGHQRLVADIIAVGRDLIGMKKRLGHGRFGAWLDAEFGWTDRTARSFMAASEVFGGRLEPNAVTPRSWRGPALAPLTVKTLH